MSNSSLPKPNDTPQPNNKPHTPKRRTGVHDSEFDFLVNTGKGRISVKSKGYPALFNSISVSIAILTLVGYLLYEKQFKPPIGQHQDNERQEIVTKE